MIEILSQSPLATVQDLGRTGALRWGVGTAGAMDVMALACGNILVGNDDGAAGIEIPILPFELRLTEDRRIAITGADCAATLDDVPVLPWSGFAMRAGQVLRLGLARAGRWRGARAYVCVAGGIDVPVVLNSRSTQLRGAIGGQDGRVLRQGDLLPCGASGEGTGRAPTVAIVPPALDMPREVDGVPAIRVIVAAEYERFTPESRAAFWVSPWKITTQSDRYGYRLAGPSIDPIAPMELRSHGIVPGVIQVPHGGQPIIQMRDAQPSGGYPKIATVIDADLWRLGQAPIGSHVRFVETDWDEAIAALDTDARWIAEVRRLVGLAARGGRGR